MPDMAVVLCAITPHVRRTKGGSVNRSRLSIPKLLAVSAAVALLASGCGGPKVPIAESQAGAPGALALSNEGATPGAASAGGGTSAGLASDGGATSGGAASGGGGVGGVGNRHRLECGCGSEFQSRGRLASL